MLNKIVTPDIIFSGEIFFLGLQNLHAIEVVRQLKANSRKKYLISGGASLATLLLKNQLIDKVNLRIHPVIVGSGIPVFSEKTMIYISPWKHQWRIEMELYPCGTMLRCNNGWDSVTYLQTLLTRRTYRP